MIESHILKSKNSTKSIMIMLHGYGSDGADMLGIANIMAESLENTTFICPDAPEDCENGFGHQWFTLENPSFNERKKHAYKSMEELKNFIKEQSNINKIEPENIIIMGFSQGGMMALLYGLTSNLKYAGVIGCSTMLVIEEKEKINKTTPVLLTHGALDTVIDCKMMEDAKDFLIEHKINVETILRAEMEHSIDDVCINSMIEFAKKVLKY